MHVFVATWLIAAAAVPGPLQAERTPPAPTTPAFGAPENAAPAIAIKETEPARLVYMEHRGPYWTVGPQLAQVHDYMLTHNLTSPMFVRFLDSPLKTGAGSLRAEVGFVLEGEAAADLQFEPPFKIRRRGPEMVACQVLENRSATTRHDYARVYDWIEAHGHEAAGPVTEIFYTDLREDKRFARRTELLVTLWSAAPPTDTTLLPVERSEPQAASRIDAAEAPLPPVAPEQPQPVDATDAEVATSRQEAAESSGPPAGISTRHEEAQVRDPGAPESVPQVDRSDHAASVQPVRELILAEQFDRLAEQLMPDGCRIPVTLQVWFGQVVFRLGAAAKGAEQVYPGEEKLITEAVNAIRRRYKVVSAGFELDPLNHAVVRMDVRGDPLADQKRAIMRDVDHLLGKIAFRSIGPEDIVSEFCRVVQRVQDLMRAHGCRPFSPTEGEKQP